MKPAIIFVFTCMLFLSAHAQVTVAISDFQNQTGKFYLDAWGKQIPEFLKSELSRSPELTLLERKNLKAVLEEQALTMAGLVDSATAQQVGKLAGAQYLITGTITEVGSRVRIDAKIVNVTSGKVISEKVDSPHQKYLSEMVELLGNNLRHQLTGGGKYKEKISLKKCPTLYFLAGTGAALTATLLVNKAFHDRQDEYRSATNLEDFDRLYDSANRLNTARYVLATVTGIGAVITIYCWAKNLSPDEVLAAQLPVMPYVTFPKKGEFTLGIQFKL
jgi:TolB-like protein